MVQEFLERLGGLEALVRQLVRVGTVASVNDTAGTCRVTLPDADNMQTYDLRVIQRKTHKDKNSVLPDVGEHVLCLFLPYGQEQGFVLGAFYSATDLPPVGTRDKAHWTFADGTVLEYDRKLHKLSGKVQGSVELTATGDISATSETSVHLQAPEITVQGGQINYLGPMTAGSADAPNTWQLNGPMEHKAGDYTNPQNDVVASGISLVNHTHTCPTCGETGKPK